MHLLTLLLVLMFALVIAYFCYSVYFYGGRWVANPYNPRISSQKRHVVMGTLTDRDGTVLAYTDEEGRRRYNGSAATRKAVCQVVGDSGGKVSTGADTFHARFCWASAPASSSGWPMPLPARPSAATTSG